MSLEAAVADAVGSGVESLRRVGGGDINDAYRAELADGRAAFVKTRAGAPPGEYAAEAAALAWLAEPGAIGVPDSVPDELSVRPGGNDPVPTLKVYGAMPPLAVNVCEYDEPATPLGSGEPVRILSCGCPIVSG